jgi:hypothetical protein
VFRAGNHLTVTEFADSFAERGVKVARVDFVKDKLTGRFRGYAFADFDKDPPKDMQFGIRYPYYGTAEEE